MEPVRAEPLREAALCGKSVLFASRNRALGGAPGALLVLGAGNSPTKGCARPATPTTGRLPHTGPRQPPQSMYGRHGRHGGLLVLLRQSRFRGRIIRPRMRRDPCRLTSRREGRMQSTCCRLSGGPQGNLDRASAWAARSCCCCGSNSCEHSASSSSQPRVPRSLPASGT